MAYTNIEEFSSMHLDVLREIGNIGSGNAATALASLLNTVVDIEVPVISLVSYDKVADYLGGRHAKALGMTVDLEGDIRGCMLEVVHLDFAKQL
ncbi:MAG: chemotaxis protein CheC, partial [Eubacterium sp.]|nr:chemotaxis protein CheC [Eubacterium sp.]